MQPEENPLTVEKLREAERDGSVGVLVADYGPPELMAALAETPLPVVSIGVRDPALLTRKLPFQLVRNDNSGIGAAGAAHFLKRGIFKSYGFVMAGCDEHGRCYAAERRDAFLDAVAASAPMAARETFPASRSPGSEEDLSALATWIAALPKPAAVMAACDWRAVQVLDACGMTGDRTPESVAILGVDNDEFLCSHTSPPLSSVQPGHVEMGFLAAKGMEQLLSARQRKVPGIVSAPCKSVIERESTMVHPPSSLLVNRAKRYIRSHAAERICVKDVVSYLCVSRRLAETRFRAATGESIGEALEAARMVRLKRLLVTTRRPIASLVKDCGFGNPSSLAHLFKKRFGSSMSEWRARKRPR